MAFQFLGDYISNPYLRALIVLVATFVVLKVFVFIIGKILIFFLEKAKPSFDGAIMKKISTPMTVIILIIGLRLALAEVTLSEPVGSTISNIIYSFLILFAGYLVFVVIDFLISCSWKRFQLRSKTKIDENLRSLTRTFLKIIWIVLAFLYILDLWGVQIGPFLAGLGIAGIAVALALQPTLSNVFSGLAMILDKTVRANDLVYLEDGTKGKILKIGLRSTKLLTFDNELIILPNSKLADSKIQNVALPEPKSRVVIPFSVAYGSNIEKVKKVVLKEIKSVAHVLDDPKPFVRFVEMADSSLNFKAYFYVDTFEKRFAAIDQANTKIYNALNKAKIKIPFPQLDVHLKR